MSDHANTLYWHLKTTKTTKIRKILSTNHNKGIDLARHNIMEIWEILKLYANIFMYRLWLGNPEGVSHRAPRHMGAVAEVTTLPSTRGRQCRQEQLNHLYYRATYRLVMTSKWICVFSKNWWISYFTFSAFVFGYKSKSRTVCRAQKFAELLSPAVHYQHFIESVRRPLLDILKCCWTCLACLAHFVFTEVKRRSVS